MAMLVYRRVKLMGFWDYTWLLIAMMDAQPLLKTKGFPTEITNPRLHPTPNNQVNGTCIIPEVCDDWWSELELFMHVSPL